MLDRICPGLASNARRQGAPKASDVVKARCSNHCRASKIAACAGAEKRAGNPLGRVVIFEARAFSMSCVD